MSYIRFVRSHKLSTSISIFLIIMFLIHMISPPLIYNKSGGFRQFGIGYRDKTILPIWIISILIAILSYLAVLHYTVHT
jgi:hypothetical protein